MLAAGLLEENTQDHSHRAPEGLAAAVPRSAAGGRAVKTLQVHGHLSKAQGIVWSQKP